MMLVGREQGGKAEGHFESTRAALSSLNCSKLTVTIVIDFIKEIRFYSLL